MLTLHFDGLCEPVNPGGVACWGYVIRDDGQVIASGSGVAAFRSGATSNVAEYAALIAGLEALIERGLAGHVEVCGDSQLVICQMTGEWAVRSARLYPLVSKAQALAAEVGAVSYRWIPRDENAEADALSRAACRERMGKTPPSREFRQVWRRHRAPD